jgi:hypothetical protein
MFIRTSGTAPSAKPAGQPPVGFAHHDAVTENTPQAGILELEKLLYPDLYKFVDPASRAAQVGWGVFFTVAHQIKAVLTLHRDELCFSAGPNRRTVIEYALFLAWLTDDGDAAVDALNRSLQSNQKLLASHLRERSLLDQFPTHAKQELAKTVAEPLEPHPDERLIKPWHLIEEYDSSLKPFYAAESRFSHVSMTSVQFFMKVDGDTISLSQTPVPEEALSCENFCLHTYAQAFAAFNRLLVGQPWTAELARIADEFGADIGRPTRKAKSSGS